MKRTTTARPAGWTARGAALLLALPVCLASLSGCASLLEAMGVSREAGPSPTSAPASAPLVVNEAMSSNSTVLVADDGTSPDWIELHNPGGTAVDLAGYGLSDDLRKPYKWTFPQVSIGPGAYLLVHADGSGAETPPAAGEPLRASFRLDGAGETVMLTDPSGNAVSRVELPELPEDISYGRVETAAGGTGPRYAFFGRPTPGRANEGEGAATPGEAVLPSDAALSIREVMSRNTWTLYDADGDSPDWVEIGNDGDVPVDLSGFGLSTDVLRPMRWTFPEMALAPGDVVLVLLGGKDTSLDASGGTGSAARIQAEFRLGEGDAVLLLSDRQGRQVDRTDLPVLPADVSMGRRPEAPDRWAYFPMATPGDPNATVGFDTLEELRAGGLAATRAVHVSEVFALGATDFDAKTRATEGDWIELHNASAGPVDLTGYALDDRSDRTPPMVLSAMTIPPGGYLQVTVDFGLAASGERIRLSEPSGRTVDVFDAIRLRPGQSCGRPADGSEGRRLYSTPTPGRANDTAGFAGYAAPVSFRMARGAGPEGAPAVLPADDGVLYCTGTVTVALATGQEGATVRYTTDGSSPTAGSTVYREPLVLSSSTVVRAAAFADGFLPSDPTTRTFLFEAPHDLPVVCLSLAPDDFLSSRRGIWTNYYKHWERSANVSYHETDGRLGTAFDVGVRLHGETSRKQDQKSLEILLREEYGQDSVTYPFFPGRGVSRFKRLILRSSGQDWKYTKMRDGFMTEAVAGYAELDSMAVRSCVLYVNGMYWGLYEIREKMDEFHFQEHYGADPDRIDLFKGDSIELEGSKADYLALRDFARTHDLRVQAHYDHVCARIDETSLMDFLIVYSFFGNRDSGNKKIWRENVPGAEWRWCMYDFDWAMFPNTWQSDTLGGDLFNLQGHGANDGFPTDLHTALIRNPVFRDAFFERYEWFLDEVFETERLLAVFDAFQARIASEMPRQVERWGLPATVGSWNANVLVLRDYVARKNEVMRRQLAEFRASLGG